MKKIFWSSRRVPLGPLFFSTFFFFHLYVFCLSFFVFFSSLFLFVLSFSFLLSRMLNFFLKNCLAIFELNLKKKHVLGCLAGYPFGRSFPSFFLRFLKKTNRLFSFFGSKLIFKMCVLIFFFLFRGAQHQHFLASIASQFPIRALMEKNNFLGRLGRWVLL